MHEIIGQIVVVRVVVAVVHVVVDHPHIEYSVAAVPCRVFFTGILWGEILANLCEEIRHTTTVHNIVVDRSTASCEIIQQRGSAVVDFGQVSQEVGPALLVVRVVELRWVAKR